MAASPLNMLTFTILFDNLGLDVRSNYLIIWASTRENPSSGFANNKGADQPTRLCSLISTFVIRLLKSIISRPATNEISIFQLVFVAEQACLNLTSLKTLKTGFLALRPI